MSPFIIRKRVDFDFIRLVDSSGNFHERVYIGDAKKQALLYGLDLVCFSLPKGKELAFCKILDYGKLMYNLEKQKKKERKKIKDECKEIRFSPVIAENDLNHKVKQVISFLQQDFDVVINMQFKGIHKRLFDVGSETIQMILSILEKKADVVWNKKTSNNISVKLKNKKQIRSEI